MQPYPADTESYFRELLGFFCWGAKRGYGTMLTLQFGYPSIRMREPSQVPKGTSRKVRELFRRRQVFLKGEWSLWVQDARWRITTWSGAVDLDSKSKKIDKVLSELDGQKVCAVRQGERLTLEFDLGAELELGPSIFPDDPESPLWMLSKFADRHISLGNSGRIKVETSE